MPLLGLQGSKLRRMEFAGISAALVTGFAFGGAFLGMAWKADDGISKKLKEDLSLWLMCIESEEVGKSLQRWPTHFAALFDNVFGEKHLSWRCFLRSCIASVLAVVLCTAIFTQVAPGEWASYGGTWARMGVSGHLFVIGWFLDGANRPEALLPNGVS